MAQRIMDDVEAVAGPQHHVVAIDTRNVIASARWCGARRSRSCAARLRRTSALRIVRAQAVGADQRRALDAAAVGGRDRDAVAVILEAGDGRGRREFNSRGGAAGIEQHVMQIDAMDD